MIVVDASIVGPVLLNDEEPLSDPLVTMLIQGPLTAPTHWPLEIVNLLQSAARRRRLTQAEYQDCIEQAQAFRVALATDTGHHVWKSTATLAMEHRLTIYDAAYLDLAVRIAAPLATLDGDLIEAGRRLGVTVLTRRP